MDATVQRVRDHGRSIIDGELRRLDRRAGQAGLTADQLDAIEDALEGVLQRILLVRLERVAARRPDLLPAAAELVDPSVGTHPAAEPGDPAAHRLPA